MADLNGGFADIVASGVIRSVDHILPEWADAEVVDLPRRALRFDKIHYGRLRRLIDAVNELVDA